MTTPTTILIVRILLAWVIFACGYFLGWGNGYTSCENEGGKK